MKYEVDKDSGALFVDRFMMTAMHYPANYGYVPQTISEDEDPVDVLVHTPFPLLPGVVVRCRALGLLRMDDESGGDAKVLAVATDDICPLFSYWKSIDDVPEMRLKQIQHFFEHYKDLEPGKWVRVVGWAGVEAAHREIMDGVARTPRKSAPDLAVTRPVPSARRGATTLNPSPTRCRESPRVSNC